MPNPSNDGSRIERSARLRWVPIAQTRVNPIAQREFRQSKVDKLLASEFDPDRLQNPTLNHRDSWFYIVDGQHRIEMLRQMGYGDQAVQCWVHTGLTEQQEADLFLFLNDNLPVNIMEKHKVGITAGRDIDCEIDRIVRAQGLCVTLDEVPGAIGAIGTLYRVYHRADSTTLGRSLRLARDAYGDPGLRAAVIDGLALLCQRYNGQLEDPVAADRLAKAHGGVNGLLGKAEVIRRTTGNQKANCVAAAAVDIINAGRSGKKLPSWWKA